MSDIEPSQSFDKRRKMMKNVEDIIAKAEASYGVNFDDDVHVSDVSTSSEEDSVSGEVDQNVDVTNLFDIRNAPASSLGAFRSYEILKSEPTIRSRSNYIDKYSKPEENKAAGGARSLTEEINLETYTVTTQTNDEPKKSESFIYSSHKLPNQPRKEETFRYTTKDDSSEVQRKISNFKNKILESSEMAFQRAPPQDRSVASSKSKKSADGCSVATPMVAPYEGNPVISPPFSLLSPPRPYTSRSSRYRRSETKKKAPTPVVLSPPKTTSTANRKSSYFDIKKERTSNANSKSSYFDIKKEIDDLTSQFSAFHKDSAREHGSDADPDKMFQDDLNAMGRKSTALVDALQESYIRTDQLQRDNKILREQLDSLSNLKPGRDESDSNRALTRRKSQETLLRELEPRDDFVQRAYPSVPKTPGTMFATEFVEVMQLDVGEHAYLADLMDRQWRSTSDYRIP